MKDLQKIISTILSFSLLTGYITNLVTPILGSTVAGYLTSVGFVSAIFYLFYSLWKYHLWKVPILSDTMCFVIGFQKYPNLSGLWEIKYTSSFKTAKGFRKRGSGKVVIEQNYEDININDGLFTDSSIFESYFVGLKQNSKGRWFLIYAYENTPIKPFIDRLGGAHTGFVYLEMKNNDCMTGYYATDKLRQTYGEITFTRK